jgi:hypothetical protein
MPIEKTQSTDTVASGLIAKTSASEGVGAAGVFTLTCLDKDGNLKWEEKGSNLVVNEGLQYMVATSLDAGAQTTLWYLGLIEGPGASVSGTATMATKGFTEVTAYSQSTRPQCVFGTATTANPSVIDNTASTAQFDMTGTATVGGAFLTSSNVKSPGTAGILFSGKAFSSPGDRSVVNGDILRVTYSFSLTGT